MNDRQLECFIQVARSGSFRAAAQQLFVSQPAVTQQIKSLERLLGATLFERNTTHVSLTEEGRAFLDRAVPLLEQLRETEAMFKSERHIVLNYFFSHGIDQVAHLFLARHPGATLQLVRTKTIGAMGDAIARPHTLTFVEEELVNRVPDLVFVPLFPVIEQVVAAPQNPLASRATCTIDDLRSQTLLRYLTPASPHEDFKLDLRTRTALTPSATLRCESVDEALNMARANCGVALFLLPANIVTPGLAHIVLEPPAAAMFGVAYLKANETPQLVDLARIVQEVYTGGEPLVL